MTKSANQEPPKVSSTSPLEQALIRRLSDEPFRPNVSAACFERIAGWPEASNCLLAVQVILSHRFDRNSPLYDQAGDWIRALEYPGLVLAVALQAASWPIEGIVYHISESILSLVTIHFVVSRADRFYRDQLEQGKIQQMGWKELLSIAGVKKYEVEPCQADMTDDCRRLMTNLPLGARASIAAGYIESVPLEKMSLLRQTIVQGLTVWPNVELLLAKIGQQLPSFASELTQLLTNAEPITGDVETLKAHFDRMMATTAMFTANLATLPEAERCEIANELTTHEDRPWLSGYRLPIYKAASAPSHKLLLGDRLGFCWRPKDPYHVDPEGTDRRNQDNLKAFSDHIKTKLQETLTVAQVINALEADRSASLFTAYISLEKIHSDGIVSGFLDKMTQNPDAFITALSPLIRAGTIDYSILKTYLRAVGLDDRNIDDVRQWLLRDNSSHLTQFDDKCSDFIRDYVIPHGLPAKWFLEGWRPLDILSAGYELKPEDVSQRSVKQMFSSSRALDSVAIFENQQWRAVLLSTDREQEPIIRALLKVAHVKYKNAQAWLEPKLPDTLTEAHPGLRRTIIDIALSDEGLTEEGETARDFLLNGRMGWLSKEDREKRVPAFVKANWRRLLAWEPKIADFWIPEEEQYDLFFSDTSDKDDKFSRLRAPDHLFARRAGKQRLATWMLTHFSPITKADPLGWLDWVSHYHLMTNRGIRNQVNGLIDHPDVTVAERALAIRNNYLSPTKQAAA